MKKLVSIKRIRKGRFYLIHDGSKTGHPGMVYWKSDKKNIYLSLTTGTTHNKESISLRFPIDKTIKRSYVNKRPFLGRRKDYGSKEMQDMRFNKKDKKLILTKISKKEPRYSKNINRKAKRYFLKIKKKKCPKY